MPLLLFRREGPSSNVNLRANIKTIRSPRRSESAPNWSRWTALVSAVIAIGTIVATAGAHTNQLQNHERRITELETLGSTMLRTHIPEDLRRTEALESRVDKMDPVLADLRTKVSSIEAKVDLLLQTQRQPNR